MIPFKIDASHVLGLVGELRESGERVLLELRQRNLGRSMGWADSAGAAFALIVGPRDLEAGEATVKRMSDGQKPNVNSMLAPLLKPSQVCEPDSLFVFVATE